MEAIYKKYPYFSKLVKINSSSINEKNNIRLNSWEDLEYFDGLLKNFFELLKTTRDIDTVLLNLLNLVGKLLYYQPFYDGNSRTLKIFLNIVLKELGYNILYKEDDYIIPMLFDSDVCSIDEVMEFKKKVGLKGRK